MGVQDMTTTVKRTGTEIENVNGTEKEIVIEMTGTVTTGEGIEMTVDGHIRVLVLEKGRGNERGRGKESGKERGKEKGNVKRQVLQGHPLLVVALHNQ